MIRFDSVPGADCAPCFDSVVPTDGYRWWYVDGVSDDGRSGIVVIAFVGSVFSPYYFSARGRGRGEPENHCAINVGLYGPGWKRWAMTERSRRSLERGVNWFRVGPSQLTWRSDRLEIDVRERSSPLARPVRGRIVVHPDFLSERAFRLDAGARHTWQPFAPSGRIEVAFDRPAWAWQGHAYLDTNAGDRPLETDFRRWNWSRSARADGTWITYAVTQADDARRSLGLRFDATGTVEEVELPDPVTLPATGWRVGREASTASMPIVERTLEDTPFYARSLLRQGADQPLIMHESLDLERFASPWVRLLLPFRMPRVR